LFLFK